MMSRSAGGIGLILLEVGNEGFCFIKCQNVCFCQYTSLQAVSKIFRV